MASEVSAFSRYIGSRTPSTVTAAESALIKDVLAFSEEGVKSEANVRLQKFVPLLLKLLLDQQAFRFGGQEEFKALFEKAAKEAGLS